MTKEQQGGHCGWSWKSKRAEIMILGQVRGPGPTATDSPK